MIAIRRMSWHCAGVVALAVTVLACRDTTSVQSPGTESGAAAAREHSEARGSAGDHAAHEGSPSEQHDHEGHHADESDIVELSEDAVRLAGIRVEPVTERSIPLTLRTTARVDFDARRLAHVSPRVDGRVDRVEHDLGDDVTAGTLLAVLDSIEVGEARSAYLQARADEELARQTLAREERLFADRITSEQAVIEARFAHKKAVAALQAATEKLRLLGIDDEQIASIHYGDPNAALLPIIAPIDGRIVAKHLVLGELVTPEDRIFTIADLSHVWIWIDIFERDLARVHHGDEVAVVTESYPGRTFHGTVSYIRDEVDADTRTARARIDVENPDLALKPGMFAEVTLTDPHVAQDPKHPRRSLAVPTSAVQRDGDQWVVFVELAAGRYQRRTIRRGTVSDEWTEVIEGVAPDERVVVEGAFLLKSDAAREQLGGGHSH